MSGHGPGVASYACGPARNDDLWHGLGGALHAVTFQCAQRDSLSELLL